MILCSISLTNNVEVCLFFNLCKRLRWLSYKHYCFLILSFLFY
nr:MAG TPA: hypothetical protein [Caudoviricetes sp.]